MPRRRATPLDHDEAVAVCEKILAKHPDIAQRREDGSYRAMLGTSLIRHQAAEARAWTTPVPDWRRMLNWP
jgi:hypothetical protein